MAILALLTYPDPRLRKIAKPVDVFDAALSTFIEDMFETMYADNGVGLAATQVNIHSRIITIDPLENDKKTPFYLINPEIIETQGCMSSQEGCLSVPGAYDKIIRYQSIKIRAQDKTGQFFEMHAQDFIAAIIQHELDHLNGKLFIDHLSTVKRERVIKQLLKLNKQKKL